MFAVYVLYFVLLRFVFHVNSLWYWTAYLFILGFLYYKYEERIKRCNLFLWLAAMFVISLAIKGGCLWTDMIFIGAFTGALIGGITVFDAKSKVLTFLGSFSYELYIVQCIPQFALQNSNMHPLLTATLMLSMDLVLGYGLHRLVTYKFTSRQ